MDLKRLENLTTSIFSISSSIIKEVLVGHITLFLEINFHNYIDLYSC